MGVNLRRATTLKKDIGKRKVRYKSAVNRGHRFGTGLRQQDNVIHQNRAQVASMSGMNRARLAHHTNVLHRK